MITKIEKYGSSWCQPCKQLDKTLQQITGINIIKYDVDEYEELANQKNIRNIPVLIYYNENDQEVKRTVGAVSLSVINNIINEL